MLFLKKYSGIFVVLLLSFWAIRPLFAPGFLPMHDDTQVARVFEMGKALKDGMFPVRWVPDLGYGYGYPIFNFYAPLAYYFGGFLTLLGFDALIATKIMMMVGILLSGIFMYILAREFWGKIGGVISALFYVYAPYHALDIYVRGDVAEFWAYAFIPLMFLGFYKIQKFGVLGGLGFAGIILSHNLTALMVTPFLITSILFLIIFSKKETRILNTLYLILYTSLGLALSAFYWIPALFEMKYTNILSQIGGGADFRDHFVCLSQLWESNWGFGGSALGCISDGMSFVIGKLHVFAVFIALFLTVSTGKFFYILRHSGKADLASDASRISTVLRDSGLTSFARMTGFILLSILGFAISVFMMLEISKPVWETIPQMAFFQYPWRFLILASFFSSLLAGFYVWYLKAKFSDLKYLNTVLYLSIGGLIFLLINFNLKLFQPQTLVLKTADDYTNEIALKWTASKISDEYLAPNFRKPKSEREIARSPAIRPKETILEKVSNIISLISSLSLIAGIILFRTKAKA